MNLSNTENVEDYDSSSSSEDEGRFGFWGAGGGSSGSLSKYMAKREKESKRDLQKELAAKRESEMARDRPELAKAELAKAELAKAELAKVEQARQELAQLELANAEAAKDIERSMGSRALAGNLASSQKSLQLSQSFHGQMRASAADLQSDRMNSIQQSREQVYEEPKRSNIDNSAAVTNAMIAAYVSQAMNQNASFENRGIPREAFDAEPELLDSIPASKVLRRIGAYRNWTEEEIQADLNALEFHRLRTVKDMRELSYDSWKEIKELLPLVRELLIKEINKGRNVQFPRPDVPLQQASGSSSFSIADVPVDIKSVRAPTSTPMDSPDMGQYRRTFQGRQW